jgi:hypothetical protein
VRRVWVMALILGIVLVFSSLGLAASFSADASYLLGKVTVDGEDEFDQWGFMVGVSGELYPNVVLDGRFLNASEKAEEAGDAVATQTMLSGALSYRLLQEGDFEVLVGGGYQTYNRKGAEGDVFNAAGIFGKLSLALRPVDKMMLVGDVSYAPSFKYTIEGVDVGAEPEDSDAFLTGRVSLSYQVMDQLSVQATVIRTSFKEHKSVNLLYGGGVVLTF